MSPRGPACWGALVLDVRADDEETVIATLGEEILGAEVDQAAPGRVRIQLFVDSPKVANDRLPRAAAALRAQGIDPDRAGLRTREVSDGRWVERYQARLHPLPLGRGFRVVPVDRGTEDPGRRDIHLVPGRAFGTGEHPTTRLCGAALEGEVRGGHAWVDLGCGSGVLSVVAALCGAARVLALDVDPVAIEVCREVVAANNLCGRIRTAIGSAAEAEGDAWDGVVVNISAAYLIADADRLAGLVSPGGRLIASGFLAEDAADVERALTRGVLEPIRREAEGGWVALVLSRKS